MAAENKMYHVVEFLKYESQKNLLSDELTHQRKIKVDAQSIDKLHIAEFLCNCIFFIASWAFLNDE